MLYATEEGDHILPQYVQSVPWDELYFLHLLYVKQLPIEWNLVLLQDLGIYGVGACITSNVDVRRQIMTCKTSNLTCWT